MARKFEVAEVKVKQEELVKGKMLFIGGTTGIPAEHLQSFE